jgi:hypothetical protein
VALERYHSAGFATKHRSYPKLAIEAAELDGFGNVIGRELFDAREVGDSARDFENPVVSPRAEILFGHGHFQQFHRRLVEGAVGTDFFAAHARVARNSGLAGKAGLLALPRCDDALANLRGLLASRSAEISRNLTEGTST